MKTNKYTKRQEAKIDKATDKLYEVLVLPIINKTEIDEAAVSKAVEGAFHAVVGPITERAKKENDKRKGKAWDGHYDKDGKFVPRGLRRGDTYTILPAGYNAKKSATKKSTKKTTTKKGK